ncbi:LVIVD repeat-containing protein [Sunxiuqinia elliptica]|uniref:LVIVD repeat-containing protein n=1 Tax=Sunxiuqinia elliptica TaxID=655355 RepID=A0A4R6H9J9_9BACT|nr:hypothetical protein [Sunxiuqinia elliptica]TDO04784.1 LVIVD repeat-containing protein [Sunxiuqinia elliptica]TDO64331.1 LVIVD repeat-containing protein [Sunxiuqinia elliptica]
MNTKWIYSCLLFVAVVFAGCEDKIVETYLGNSPVYMSYDDLRNAVKMESARDIENPGKIYFKDNYIFINEVMKGVHVVDVSDPASPNSVGFIAIPGNVDIAIKENILYADSYIDLVAVDVSDLASVKEVGRVEDIFPYMLPEYDPEYRLGEVDDELGVVVDWEIKKVKREIERNYYPIYYYDSFSDRLETGGSFLTNSGVGGGSGTTFGVGGSMARFGLYKDFLYTVDNSTLYTFRITDLENPQELGSNNIGWNVETMFIYNDHLFFGTTTGMLIYSLEIEQSPKYINRYQHITSCDPVVVQDDLAYVTLHDGGGCGRSVNRLDVIEMNDDYSQLTPIASYSMANPHGLGIDDDVLFICDGDAGLKVFDASDPLQIGSHLLAEFEDINTYDVIPLNNYLFMVGDGGFYLYDYSDLQDIQLIATIPVSTTD